MVMDRGQGTERVSAPHRIILEVLPLEIVHSVARFVLFKFKFKFIKSRRTRWSLTLLPKHDTNDI